MASGTASSDGVGSGGGSPQGLEGLLAQQLDALLNAVAYNELIVREFKLCDGKQGLHQHPSVDSSSRGLEDRLMPVLCDAGGRGTAAVVERACEITTSSASITSSDNWQAGQVTIMNDDDDDDDDDDADKRECVAPPDADSFGSLEVKRTRFASDPRGQRLTETLSFHLPGSSNNGLREPLLGDAREHAVAAPENVVPTGFKERRGEVFRGVSEVKKHVARSLSSSPKANALREMRAGFWADIVQDQWFQSVVLVLIIVNSLWIAVAIDYSKEDVPCDGPVVVQAVDNVFCVFFLFEIIARFLALQNRCSAFQDAWFVFDSSLVLMMVGETWLQVAQCFLATAQGYGGRTVRSLSVLRIFRIFRLLRVARLSRLFRAIPELQILVKAMTAGLRAMLLTLAMLIIIIYIMSLLFTQLLRGTAVAVGRFETVPQSASFMLSQVLCGFDSDLLDKLSKEGLVFYLLWLLYILVGSLVLLNLLTGILCDVVSSVADGELEGVALQDLEAEVARLDANGDGSVSKDECGEIVKNPVVIQHLHELGVDVSAFLEFAHFVFDECPVMSSSDFVEMVVQFRGSKACTVKDIVDLRKFVTMEVNHLQALILKAISSQSPAGCKARIT